MLSDRHDAAPMLDVLHHDATEEEVLLRSMKCPQVALVADSDDFDVERC